VKAEAAKCAVCIPDTGLRAWEFSRSSAQANTRRKKDKLYGVGSFGFRKREATPCYGAEPKRSRSDNRCVNCEALTENRRIIRA